MNLDQIHNLQAAVQIAEEAIISVHSEWCGGPIEACSDSDGDGEHAADWTVIQAAKIILDAEEKKARQS